MVDDSNFHKVFSVQINNDSNDFISTRHPVMIASILLFLGRICFWSTSNPYAGNAGPVTTKLKLTTRMCVWEELLS